VSSAQLEETIDVILTIDGRNLASTQIL